MSCLNLNIIHSPHDITIYQTDHIKNNIISLCLPDISEHVNSSPTPFKSDSAFEIELDDNIPDTPAEIHNLEKSYLGKFSTYIGKFLHIMQ